MFGDDYDTPDGTGVRDIHVVDWPAAVMWLTLEWMGGKVIGTGKGALGGSLEGEAAADGSRRRGVGIFNLASGAQACSMVHAFERGAATDPPTRSAAPCRRRLPPTTLLATRRAPAGWVAEYDLDRMCADSWRWQSMNPDGYATEQ